MEPATKEILAILLALEPDDRVTVFAEVRFNGIFCPECGFGSRDDPNENCPCSNDE